jgi:hypothetical protein
VRFHMNKNGNAVMNHDDGEDAIVSCRLASSLG